jgi:hypothetical protein
MDGAEEISPEEAAMGEAEAGVTPGRLEDAAVAVET